MGHIILQRGTKGWKVVLLTLQEAWQGQSRVPCYEHSAIAVVVLPVLHHIYPPAPRLRDLDDDAAGHAGTFPQCSEGNIADRQPNSHIWAA
jgi:hypothetical protein